MAWWLLQASPSLTCACPMFCSHGTQPTDQGTTAADCKLGYGDNAEADWAAAWERCVLQRACYCMALGCRLWVTQQCGVTRNTGHTLLLTPRNSHHGTHTTQCAVPAAVVAASRGAQCHSFALHRWHICYSTAAGRARWARVGAAQVVQRVPERSSCVSSCRGCTPIAHGNSWHVYAV